ncbi:hypothetical protein CtesDRAFT_PD2679 [Comamonas testosteroni KF-1]|uniref:Uncharacterized protein n=1 Tax=Comamonas testosteroni (strain DSM 14576 / KF-1) TaxID=399795 RepID=B7WVW1_COMTK|nr:hypothetical protein CtesDRAFT_PD2679 [Comamonas testosteroni KF-1]
MRMPWQLSQCSNVALMYSGPSSQRITSGLPRQAMICVSTQFTRYEGREKSTFCESFRDDLSLDLLLDVHLAKPLVLFPQLFHASMSDASMPQKLACHL